MKKKIICLFLTCILVLFCSCTNLNSDSTFSIHFIDVGQGDSALVECDGHYMLIDGGEVTAADKVYSVLEQNGVQRLDILAISHLHTDHIGGLEKALTYAQSIGITISNSDSGTSETFRKVEHQLSVDGSTITVPNEGATYSLGSASVEVIDVSNEENNDSLVLMITYGDTRFLFTGDIEDATQTRIANKYQNDQDKEYKISLMKLPHHGSSSPHSYDGTGSLYYFLRTFNPDFVIISVGAGNPYGHPHRVTLDLLEQLGAKVYRTDYDGDIIVKSNGKTLSIETSK